MWTADAVTELGVIERPFVVEREGDDPQERLGLARLDLPEEHAWAFRARLDCTKSLHGPLDTLPILETVAIATRPRDELAIELTIDIQGHSHTRQSLIGLR